MSKLYQSLDDKAKLLGSGGSIASVVDRVVGETMFGPLASSLRDRIVRSERAFRSGDAARIITEANLAKAVNDLGLALGGPLYTGTNALQIRLLRVAMLNDLPNLVYSPLSRDDKDLVGGDLTPCGALWMGLILLRQKLSNPAWFGDPVEQNQKWMAATSPATHVRFGHDSPAVTALITRLGHSLNDKSSNDSKAFGQFLTEAGFLR